MDITLLSSIKGKAIKLYKAIIVGESGLRVEVRPIAQCEKIANEASKLGSKILLYQREIQRSVLIRILIL